MGRNSYAQRTVGRKERLPDDDGYHLITQTFGGSIYFNRRLL
ncbi:DNA/RNA non-specific endonuclease [Staphylococcus epidermidis]|nr:DNA/RNA non-specific endonuclease [Staphylococcus epidermidis]